MSRIGDNLQKMFSLEGKVCVFTGAGGGIGSELSYELALAGATLALCDIDMIRLNAVRTRIEEDGGSASCHLMNVADLDSIAATIKEIGERYGHIDVLVNCAGINKREGLMDVDEATYDRIMNINLKGVLWVSRAVAPYMMAQKSGSIINIGSHNTGMVLGGVGVYAATKSGVLALTRSMAVEWAKYNIRANLVSPGHILTPLTEVTWEHPERSKYLTERIAMRRPGLPEEIAGVCVLLASDASRYITGSEYRVDGGCICGGSPWPYDTKY